MSQTNVANESELSLTQTYYLRLKSDPKLLCASNSGELFVRRDGREWEWPAYKVVKTVSSATIEPWTCMADATVYRSGRSEQVEHKNAEPKAVTKAKRYA